MKNRSGSWAGRQAGAREWSARAGIPWAATLIACSLLFPGGCCLVRPPDAETLYAAGNGGLRTPEAAFETFRVAFGSDMPPLEYRCLSEQFRREQGISYQTYRVARQKLIEENPLLPLLAKAKVVESKELSARRHRLTVEVAGRRFAVELVRQDEFQIYKGAVFLADGSLDFASGVHVSDSGAGKQISAVVLLKDEEIEGVDLGGLTSFRIEQVWKISRFTEDPPAP